MINKIYRKRSLTLRTTGMCKLTSINPTESYMDLNLLKYSMKQDRHKFFTQNSAFMKHSRKSVAHWAGIPSKALITKDIRGIKSIGWLESVINKNNQQQVGCFSSGQWRRSHLSVRMPHCTFLDFCQMSDSAVKDCS